MHTILGDLVLLILIYVMSTDNEHLYQDIPEEFYSFETKSPFERCIECEKYLLDGEEYVIEKAIKRYDGYSATDTVFDYAICIRCAEKMRQEFSRESLQRIDAYFGDHFNFMNISRFNPKEDLKMEECLSKCMIKDIPQDKTREYQIYAFCKGNKLLKSVPPYMVSGEAIDEILPLLSQPTTDFLNGFFNKHFGPDPALMQPEPGGRLVFI